MVLLVEPDDRISSRLLASLDGVDDVHRCRGFKEARACLRTTAPDLLVSNLRLREFNGLQLVYCAVSASDLTPALVYTTTFDLAFAQEIQRAGAFYDTVDCLVISLRTYLAAALPRHDRRNPQRRHDLGDEVGRRITDWTAGDWERRERWR
jgi:DNA-binding NtrC family response regulator